MITWIRKADGSLVMRPPVGTVLEDGDEITLDVGSSSAGWRELGVFYYSDGRAVVELTDNSDGRMVYADAVRFRKISE